jgi:hypothetical protein
MHSFLRRRAGFGYKEWRDVRSVGGATSVTCCHGWPPEQATPGAHKRIDVNQPRLAAAHFLGFG